ncbi:putative transcriptional regulator [Cylindrobasidium torrendii FP15055 ss-10]|uniref:Putative transcriptional regulator n=1 Tax=Cylindrobasidium torrendii FP15055 ss-10 TaxID=1314674 RepID=A0A0D7BV20_9AGAR|nr:putative transcriptional regulator [Cylindrobasidium torrendii FP15055 ss-10]
MYSKPVHAETDPAVMYALIQSQPLGIIISALPAPDSNTPQIQLSHIPWVLDVPDGDSKPAVLRGHITRANPQAKALLAHCTDGVTVPVTVLFNAPAHYYVTTKFYSEEKHVPTWDYAAVEIRGQATIHASDSAFLKKQLDDLSEMCERKYTEGEPWAVTDAPERYIELLKKAILGVEVEIVGMEGKWKMSQELSKQDRQGVVQGFEAYGTDLGNDMAACVHARGSLRDAQVS